MPQKENRTKEWQPDRTYPIVVFPSGIFVIGCISLLAIVAQMNIPGDCSVKNRSRMVCGWTGGIVGALLGTLLLVTMCNASGYHDADDCALNAGEEVTAAVDEMDGAEKNGEKPLPEKRVRVPKAHGQGGLYSPARLSPEMVGLPVMTAEELARKFSTHPTMKPYGVGYAEGAAQVRLPRRRGAVQEIIGLHSLEDEASGAVTVCAGPGYQYINLDFYGGKFAKPLNKPMPWEELEARAAGLVRDIMGVFPGQYDMTLCRVSSEWPIQEFTYCIAADAGEYRVTLRGAYCRIHMRMDTGICSRFRAVLHDNVEAALANIPDEKLITEGIRQAAAALWLAPDEVRLAGDVMCWFQSTDAKEFYITVVPRAALKASARKENWMTALELEGGIRSAVVHMRGDIIQDVVLKPLTTTRAVSAGYDLEWLAHVEATGADDASPHAKGRAWVEQMSARYCAAK